MNGPRCRRSERTDAFATQPRPRYEESHQSPPVAACDTVGPARIAYVTAMIDMHAQQTVVSTLLDVLGHIPLVPAG
ncbi:transcriptional repressor TraM [Mesorhizobium sp.]|uniref:transcriptional repressor TraM n=1 Tax=Mesorhizobium sp. TaxID=1871066 RepID=UPI00257D2DF1|nr:transcriptional repressor TraM [Mesorhizobium sp.]